MLSSVSHEFNIFLHDVDVSSLRFDAFGHAIVLLAQRQQVIGGHLLFVELQCRLDLV